MGALSGIVFALGGILMLVGGIMILIKAFQESVWWGLGSLFVPLVILIFAIMNLAETKKGLMIWAAGLVLYIVGIAMFGATGGFEAMQEGMSQS